MSIIRKRSSRGVAVTGFALTLSLALGMLTVPVGEAAADPGNEKPQSSLGYPTFKGDSAPIPVTGVEYAPESSYMQKIFDQDIADGAGTASAKEFWMDRMLGRNGSMYDGTENLVAFTRGRSVFMKTHTAGTPGWVGDVAYWESTGQAGFTITASVGGQAVTLREDVTKRRQTPSYYRSMFTGSGITLTQEKFISNENVMVANLRLSSTSGAKDVTLKATSPMAASPKGDELTGELPSFNDLTRIYPRFSGDGFAVENNALTKTIAVPASGEAVTKLQLGMITEELPASTTEYEQLAAMGPDEAFQAHVTAYNKWWVDNMVYLDTPEDNIDKTLFYRWWLMRYNYLDANIPGNDYQFPTSMEGVLGYNNSIVLTVGMFIDDLKYFRDPTYAFGPALAAGETSKSYKFVDNPGDPANWNNSYTQYITEAAWRAYQIHGGPGQMGAPLGQHSEYDVKGLLDAYDTNKNGLIEYSWGAMTGNDADAVSFHWKSGNIDRAENAYLYSNSKGAANFYRVAGNTDGAQRMEELAANTRTAILDNLWEDETAVADEMGHKGNLLKHRMATGAREFNPWKEINNYYPYNVGLMPQVGDSDYDAKYVEALRLFADADEYPVFPFFTANQRDKKVSRYPNENNFSVINSTVLFNTFSSVLRDYPSEYVTPEMYKQLLYWNAFAHYQGGDNRLPNQNEFWNTASAANGGSIGYRSWIHHTILGTTNFTVIEDVAGLQPRDDGKIELSPIDIGWDYFTANNIRYHGKDLTIVWDKTGDEYDGPAGYSLYLDGERAFTADSLVPVIYDPETGVATIDEGAAGSITHESATQLPEATAVSYASDSRVVDIFAKAGTDIDPASLGSENVALGADVTASFTATGRSADAAVNGNTINEPFWGTAGSPNAKDTLEVDFGEAKAINDVRVYFYRTSTSVTVPGYAAPQLYVVEYWDGANWVPVSDQARTPVYSTANYNRVQFQEVTTQKIRLSVKHAAGAATGVKEIQAFRTDVPLPPSTNAAPKVQVSLDSTFTAPNRARIIGSVSDDGLPNGTLTSKWTVVSAPEGGNVIFADPDSASTTVQFTAKGTYVLRLTADDGELTTSADVTINNEGGELARTNVAPAAKATASATAGHNNVNAVNDGLAEFPVTDEKKAWGTWGTSAPWTVTLTWNTAQRLDGSALLFHDNGASTGMLTPKSWTLEYQDSAGKWQPVSNPSAYGTAKGVFNTVSFDSVTTKALRVTPVRNGQSYPGIVEWEAYVEEPTSVEPVGVLTTPGEAPALPETVEVVYPNYDRVSLPVEWQQIDPSKYEAEGKFEVFGFITGSALLAKAVVNVKVTPPAQINTYAEIKVNTPVGVAPSLPSTAMAVYNDGSELSVPVVWQPIDPSSYATVGTFTALGDVEGTDKTAEAQVTVILDPSIRPELELTGDSEPTASGWYSGPVEVTATATDPSDPAPKITLNTEGTWADYTGPVTISREGKNSIYAKAITADGRESGQVVLDINIDTVAPTATATFEPLNRYLKITAVDSSSGVAKIEYRVGEGTWQTYSKPVLMETGGVVEYRATDNVGNVSEAQSITVDNPATGWIGNIAPAATAAVSGSATWNSAAGINDGVVAPGAQIPQANAWGTWGVSGASHWATLTWDKEYVVDTSRVYFLDNSVGGDSGVGIPKSWTLEYLDSEGDWVEVPNVSGYPTAIDEFVTVTHDPIKTTSLRATLTKQGAANAAPYVGIIEWEVYPVATIDTRLLGVPTGDVLAGSSFDLTVADAVPGSEFAVTLNGEELGTFGIETDGTGTFSVEVPADMAAGIYDLVIASPDKTFSEKITVVGPEDPGPGLTEVTPAPPVLVPALKCGVEATVAVPSVDGVVYSSDQVGTVVTVTAVADEGFVLKAGAVASWSFDVKAEVCPPVATEVSPAPPVLVPAAKCGVEATVVVPSVEGVVYSRSQSGTTVTVTAKAAEGFVLKAGVQASWSFDVKAEACGPIDPGPGLSVPKVSFARHSGSDRYGTSLAVNEKAMKAGAPLFVATGGSFADALSVGSAVAARDGSLVLASSKGLDAKLVALIKSKAPSEVFLIGGTSSVPSAVESQLKTALGAKVSIIRVEGKDRYATSVAIVQKFFPKAPTVFVATGRGYPDALSAAGAAGTLGAPVLLVDGAASTPNSATVGVLQSVGAKTIHVVGGSSVVKDSVVAGLGAKRLSGPDRYATNVEVNAVVDKVAGKEPAGVSDVWLASGANFPDALSAGAEAGKGNQRLYLTPGTCIPRAAQAVLDTKSVLKTRAVHLVGGENLLSKDLATKKPVCTK